MHYLRIPFSVPPWPRFLTELRIDVKQRPSEIERELDALYRRLNSPGDSLYRMPVICMKLRNLVLRHREADGEQYVYVLDQINNCLAGYVVFNRLVEVDRRADPHLRAPHAKFSGAYQRLGIATAIYQWWLDAGNCLITGARQSEGANALWCSLGRRYEYFHVELRDKRLRCLDDQIDGRVLRDLHTRKVLLGKGWSRELLAQRTGMWMAPDV
ncbi:MAG: N-acetyltransferase [Gammaproteobacteria bacterium]|nr:N-acetyltransferase [Gammaproteobacteria bacterium]HMN13376.1 hypothetical protein [Bellilinea sp.]